MAYLQFDICCVILAAIHVLFKIVINLKILENYHEYVYINIEFLNRDLPVNNSAIMVKWKCLKLLYSSNGMCRIDSQLKNYRLKYLTLETPYTFFSIFSRYFIVLHTLNFLSPMFLVINNNKFSCFRFSNISFFVFVFTTLKKKMLVFNFFSIVLMWFQVKALQYYRKCFVTTRSI